MASDTQELLCQRATGQCVAVRSSLGVERSRLEFAIANVQELKFVEYRKNRADVGAVDITLKDGSRLRVARGSVDWSRDRHLALRAFFEKGQWQHVGATSTPNLGLLIPAVAVLGLGLLMLGVTLRATRVVELLVDPKKGQLEVKARTWLGGRRAESFQLQDVARVELDRGPVERPTRKHPEPPVGARLVLHYEEGRQCRLTEKRFVGDEIHESAAAELREALGLEA